MELITPLFILVVLLVLAAEFINGWTDAPNAIATVVGTKVLSPRVAVVMAVIGNILGTFAGTAVATTIGKGIVNSSVISLPLIAGAMVSVIAWGFYAARVGIPVSKSHALIAGLAGAGLAAGGWGALEWSGWQKVLTGLVISLACGYVLAWLIGQCIQVCCARSHARRARKTFNVLQVISASFMAFNHGMNDGQKFVGVLTLVLVKGAILASFNVTWQVVLLCSLTMGLGTACGGWRILRTLGEKMTRIESWQGFAAETSASFMIFGASTFGIPLSTTHTITTSILGAASSQRMSKIKFGVVRDILSAWFVTFLICTLIAFDVCTAMLVVLWWL